MDHYKEKIKIHTNSLSLVAAGTALLYLGLMFYRDRLPELPGFIQGFHTGTFIGLELFVVILLGKYMKAGKNEAAMKQLFIQENDERSGLIVQKTGSLGMSIIFVGLAIATIAAGFFNPLVFFTLLGALLFAITVFFLLMWYFSKKI